MKNIFIALLCLCTANITYSQYKGGMEVGGNIMMADLTISDPIETSSSWGIRLGYVGEYAFSETTYFRGALLINQRGFKFADERWGLNVIDLPLNVGFAPSLGAGNLKWFIDGGLNIGFSFRAFTKIDGELTTLTIGSGPDDIKILSTGFNIGTGLQFSEKLKLRVNYYNGFTNMVQSPGDEWKNQVLGVALNFFFN